MTPFLRVLSTNDCVCGGVVVCGGVWGCVWGCVCVCVCLSVCRSVCLPACRSVGLSVCLSVCEASSKDPQFGDAGCTSLSNMSEYECPPLSPELTHPCSKKSMHCFSSTMYQLWQPLQFDPAYINLLTQQGNEHLFISEISGLLQYACKVSRVHAYHLLVYWEGDEEGETQHWLRCFCKLIQVTKLDLIYN